MGSLQAVCWIWVPGAGFGGVAVHESNTPTSPCLSLLSRVNSPKRWPPGSEEWRDFPGGRKVWSRECLRCVQGRAQRPAGLVGRGKRNVWKDRFRPWRSLRKAGTHSGGGAARVAWAALVNLFQVWSLRKIFALCGCQRLKPGPLACQVGVLLLSQVSIVKIFFWVISGSELKIYSWQDQDAGSDAWKVNALSTWLSL